MFNLKFLLQNQNTELERINKELESFNYIASHDLQEPLRKIQTFISLMETNLDDTEIRKKYFDKINSASKRMSKLIQSVLDYSRFSQRFDGFERTDLNQILEKVKIDFDLVISEKNAIIESDVLPTLMVNPQQIEQLFSNIISNSLKFSQERPIIKINSRILNGDERNLGVELNPDGKYVELKFTDNGIGFEPQYKEQIFQLFQRLHNQAEYTGTGVGLSIVSKIVENHNGYIIADSPNGKGAVFTVWLPY